jgi:hypothetical protein
MSRRKRSLSAYLAFIGLILIGCGGRASVDGANEVGTSGAGSPGAIGGSAGNVPGGAGGTTQAGGITQAGGTMQAGGTTVGGSAGYVTIDNEHADDGRPVAPISSAFFWGSNSAGWRIGNWFVTSDKVRDALLSPIEPPRADSTEARRANGQGFASGVVLWLQLDHPFGRAVDLSAYSGIEFWARLKSATSAVVVSLNDGSHAAGALDGRATLPSVSLTADYTWQQFTLPFNAFGLSDPKITTVEFFVGDKGETFDLWVDDFALTCSGACP